MVLMRANRKLIDPNYLLFSLQSPHLQHQISWNEGTGTTVSNIRIPNIKAFRIPTPPLNEQKAIAHILGTLDDKIELNRQMNATLEAMAQALFKSWFVDFDPVIDNALAAGHPIPEPLHKRAGKRVWTPDEGTRRVSAMDGANHPRAEARRALDDKRNPLPDAIQKQFPSRFVFNEEMGWVPEGWNPVKLGDYVTVKRGGSPRPIHDYLVNDGLPWVKISDATASSSRFLMDTKQFIKPEGLKKTVMLKKGELILSNSATPGLPMFLNLDACIHDGWLYFPKKTLFGDLYLYQLFFVVRNELLMQGNGSIFTNLKTDILKNHMVVLPCIKLLNEIEDRLDAMHQKSLFLQLETEFLTKLRDTLLPKLLSGQLHIPDADRLAANSGVGVGSADSDPRHVS